MLGAGLTRLAALSLAAVLLNLHYVLLGRPLLEALLTSRPVLTLGNAVGAAVIRRNMLQQGVPAPDRTERYSSTPGGMRVDVYEPEATSAVPNEPRPAVLYFHSGGFIAGDRAMGAGMCGWLASHGAVCLSASYRTTNSGLGVTACIEDAWDALRWVRAQASQLNIDPDRITVAGDSAGGLLATALATGLDPRSDAPVARAELPAAVVGGWPATALGARNYAPRRAGDGRWEDTPAGVDFPVANAFVPDKYTGTQEATQQRLRTVLAGGLLCFGRRCFGLLPAATGPFPPDDAQSVSPLRLAASGDALPPMLLLTGGADQVEISTLSDGCRASTRRPTSSL